MVYDPLGAGTIQLALRADGQALQTESYNLVVPGGKTNWSGNDTVTSFIAPANAGGGTSTAGQTFTEGDMPNFAGTAGNAYFWNSTATIVPEPASAALLLLGAGGLLAARRKR